MARKVKLLRITTISHSLDLLLKGQLKYIGQHGFDISIACSKDENIQQIEEREEVSYFELRLTRTLSPLKDLVSLFRAIKLIRKLKPDIVHTHSPKAGIIGMIAAWVCRVPVKIHTVAGLPLMETVGFKRKLLVQVERIAYSCADFVLPNSLRQKEYIERNIYQNDKVQVIGKGSSNGIDLNYFNPMLYDDVLISSLKSKLYIDSNDIVFCFVGRLAHYKGVNELVRAFVDINLKYPQTKLILVGPFEDLNPLNNDTLQLINSNENIISVGHQNDIRPFLAISDIFLFPSYREGFPQSLMQAAAMNLACIASDINGCNEIVENNKTGLLVSPKDAKAIYQASEILLNNPELRRSFAQRARKSMEDDFEQRRFWDKLIQFYKQALR